MFIEEEVTFPEQLDNLIPHCIFEEENTILRKIPTLEKIKETLFQM